MDIFENADSSLRFQKIRLPTYRIRIVFARLHENAKPMDMQSNSLQDMRCIMYDIEKPAFSKISTRGPFLKTCILVPKNAVSLWTEGYNG